MAAQPLKAVILVVSETAARDPSSDRCTQALTEAFQQDGRDRWELVECKIVTDDILQIQQSLMQWSDGPAAVNLVITSGGTGFAVKDHTPEAIAPLLHRQAPGLVHAMLATSLTVTPFAMMSRPVAGVRNGTIILTLPGSPKGAVENLKSVLKLLPHACVQAAGADSRSLHAGGLKKLEAQAGIGRGATVGKLLSSTHGDHTHNRAHGHGHSGCHGHSHGSGHAMPVAHTSESAAKSNDPSQGPTRRYRSSPYPMVSVDQATETILAHTPSPQAVNVPVGIDLVGHTLAEDVIAAESVPAFRASIVDGYAVVISEGTTSKGIFPVSSVSHAAAGEIPPLKEGEITRITTGAPLPPGATSVVMVEDTVLIESSADGKEEKTVEILTSAIKFGENVREVGSDVKAGTTILRQGDTITAVGGELGILATVGVRQVSVYRKLVVGVLSTGDEIVPHEKEGALRLGEVRDCNRPSLLAAIKGAGYEAVDLGIAKDRQETLETHIRHALAKVDVLVTTGGVSMGELDLLKPTIERSLGGTIHFGRVDVKPGKPTTFATVPVKGITSGKGVILGETGDEDRGEYRRKEKLIFSLPGNPASALVTFHLFVLPGLRLASSPPPPPPPPPLHPPSSITSASSPSMQQQEKRNTITATLTHDIKADRSRPEYHRAVLGFADPERTSTSTINTTGLSSSDSATSMIDTTVTPTNKTPKSGGNGPGEHDGEQAGFIYATSTGFQRSSRVGSLSGANALLVIPPLSSEQGIHPRGTRVQAILLGALL